jgi:hypothetical protein
MILFTLILYTILYLKKRFMKRDRLLENEEGAKSSTSHSIEIEQSIDRHYLPQLKDSFGDNQQRHH